MEPSPYTESRHNTILYGSDQNVYLDITLGTRAGLNISNDPPTNVFTKQWRDPPTVSRAWLARNSARLPLGLNKD